MELVKHKRLKIFLLLLPAFSFLIFYVVSTMVANTVLSFFKYDGIKTISYVGLRNWINVFSNKDFFRAMINNLIIGVMVFLLLIPCAFGMAVQLNKKIRGVDAFKTIYFSPSVFSAVMIAMVWMFILNPYMGFFNNFLGSIGLEFLQLEWIGGLTLTPWSVGFICFWQWLGINVLIFTSGIKAIPYEYYEAASIEGASKFTITRTITFPLIKEQIVVSMILNVSAVVKVYELVVALTGGGPGYRSATIGSFMMDKMFRERQYGFGSVISVVMSVICILLSLALVYWNSRETHQQ